MSAPSAPGVLLSTPVLTLLDTREMTWEPSSYMPQALAKPLARDCDGEPVVIMRSYSERLRELPSPVGGYHLDRELYFILGGEVPHWEFDPTELEVARIERATMLTLREGYWLDRAPRSPHGGGTPRSPVGLWVISWTVDGADQFVGECESAGSPVPALSDDAESAGVVLRNSAVVVRSSRELAWQPGPVGGAPIKILSRREDGDPTVTLRWVHGEGATIGREGHQTFHEFAYVIDGELDVAVDDGPPLRLRAGSFIDARPGARWRPCGDPPDARGATLLHWRVREGVRLLGDAAKEDRTHELVAESRR